MTRAEFWDLVFTATKLLWLRCEEENCITHVIQILDFLRNEMDLSLSVTSWTAPMVYTMDTQADPEEDLPKLLSYIEYRLEYFDYNTIIIDYYNLLLTKLEKYIKKES